MSAQHELLTSIWMNLEDSAFVTHDVDMLRLADVIYVMSSGPGRIIENSCS